MKKLLTLILLLTTTQLYSTETYKLKLTKEVESCVIVKAEYALQTRNQELWNVTEGFFILSIPASFVYCWNVKID